MSINGKLTTLPVKGRSHCCRKARLAMSGYAEIENMPVDIRSVLARVWERKIRILAVTGLLCALTYVLLSFVPKTYESSASILVERRDNTFTRATNDTGASGPIISDAVIMSSQVELIQSSDTLLQVVRALNLADVPEFNGTSSSPLDPLFSLLGRSAPVSGDIEQRVLEKLSKAVTVVQERDSRVISILVRTHDPDLSARIANEIANTHVNRRAELSINDTADASAWLKDEIDKLRARVVEAESAVANFRVENDLFVGANNTSLLDQQMSNISTQITTAQERRNAARSRATLIRNLLDSGQSIDGVAEVQNSVIIQRLSQDKARLQGERAQLAATLLPDHPRLRALTAQIAEIDQQIQKEGRSVADSIMAEANIEDQLVASLQEELARLKISASSAASANVKLQELEREARAQSDLLQTYLARFREASGRAETGAVLPDVRVVNLAKPPLKPAAPQTMLIVIAVGIVAMSVQIGGILFAELATVPAAMAQAEEDPASSAFPHPLQESGGEDKADDAPAAQTPGQGSAETPVQGEGPPPVKSQNADAEMPDRADRIGESPARPAEPQMPSSAEPVITAASSHATAPAAPDNRQQPFNSPHARNASGNSNTIGQLSSALCAGEENLVFLTSADARADSTAIGETLLSDALGAGLSVAIVDAGSGVISTRPGISDLAAGDAEFGDVVFPSADGTLTDVYWGRTARIDPRSEKPATLVQALCDICDVVIVFAGRVGITSNLPLFAGLQGTLALVASAPPDEQWTHDTLQEAAAIGFDRSLVMVAPRRQDNAA